MRFRLLGGQSGIGLLEALVAVGILGLIGTGVLSALSTNAKAARVLDEQVVATNLASAYLEAIRGLSYQPDYTSAGNNITIPSQYSVAISIQYSADGTTWVDSYSDQKLQKVSILVSREGSRPVLSICTYKTVR